MNKKSFLKALILPLGACALTACGGGGGDGGFNINISGNNTSAWDASNWAAHPAASSESDVTPDAPLMNRTLTVTRPGNGDGSDTTLTYKFASKTTGSYTETTLAGTDIATISNYTYTPQGNKTGAILVIELSDNKGTHTYNIIFNSASSASGTFSCGTEKQGELTLIFSK